MTSLVVCHDVRYRYRDGTVGLQGLDLTIAPGEFVLLAGASGSGKSTLCRLLNGLIPHLHGGELSGRVLVAERDVRLTPPVDLAPRVALLLQNAEAQVVASTVARDLALGLACQGLDRATIGARVREVAAALAIEHLLERSPATLSGGELQRVALAGVLALRPALLALDEPFAFLDARGAERLRAVLRQLHRQGVTIIVAEHRLAEVIALATRLVVLCDGRVVADRLPHLVNATELEAWRLEPPGWPAQVAGHPEPAPIPGAAAPLLDGNGSRASPEAAVAAAPVEQPVIVWNQVTFSHDGQPLLRGLNLTVGAGEVLGLLGANGAGKTTVLRLGNGLLRAQGGTVYLLGRPVGRRPLWELARDVGLVPQQPGHMLFAPTVRAELEVGPRALGRDDPSWRARLIERFGLGALLDRAPYRLSAGEQRRVALAAVAAARPQALLLDEPTVGQDGPGRAETRRLVSELAQSGVAVVLATHDTAWISGFSTRWAILDEGRVVATDAPAALFNRPDLLVRAGLRAPPPAARRDACARGTGRA
ncbi:MAG: ABC transporter ATP-binding protein [Chloroflexaceae bacterium]